MGRIRVGAVHAPRAEHLDGRLFALHHADLPRRSLRTEQKFAADEEGVLHIARGVVGGDVERLEVVVVLLDLRPLEHVEAHAREDVDQLLLDEGDGVDGTAARELRGHGHVDLFARVACGELLFFQLLLARCELLLRPGAHVADQLARGGALFGRDVAHPLGQRGDGARLAEILHLQFKQLLARRNALHALADLAADAFDLLFHSTLYSLRMIFL